MNDSENGVRLGNYNVSIKDTKDSEIVIATDVYCDFYGLYVILKGRKRYVDSVKYRVKGKLVQYKVV